MALVGAASRPPMPSGYYISFRHFSRDRIQGDRTSTIQKDVITSHHDERTSQNIPRLSFLDLPLEIRLQIYAWVHILHPFKYRELAPGYPSPAIKPYHTTHLLPPPANCTPTPEGTATPPEPIHSSPPLLSPDRPFAYIPTSLLLTNRQIYHEARETPYLDNEFVFPSFFSSGLSAAGVLVRGATAWQLDALRYVRLEMKLGDLRNDKKTVMSWGALCEGLAGVRGLRLRVFPDEVLVLGLVRSWEVGKEEVEEGLVRELGGGLRVMRALRQVEVEVDGVGEEESEFVVDLCRGLQMFLDKRGQARGVKVVAVRRKDDVVDVRRSEQPMELNLVL
jgi:hypothetical protein